MNQKEFQTLLRQELAASKIKNQAYSIRAFAKKLGVSSGTLSQVLAGKRILAKKSVTSILNRLGASPLVQSKILKEPKTNSNPLATLLAADQHFVLSEWYYLAILSLVRTKNFQPTPEHISARLGISKAVAKQAIERLERLNLLKRENGKLIRTQHAFKSSDGTSNGAIRKAHVDTIELAKKSMNEHPFDSADFSFITFSFHSDHLIEAKNKIREFQSEFLEQFSNASSYA